MKQGFQNPIIYVGWGLRQHDPECNRKQMHKFCGNCSLLDKVRLVRENAEPEMFEDQEEGIYST